MWRGHLAHDWTRAGRPCHFLIDRGFVLCQKAHGQEGADRGYYLLPQRPGIFR